MNGIVFKDVDKIYGKNPVIEKLNLTVESGERLILLGPSGCGKSTTLRMIAGLEDITSGDLFMDGSRINDVSSGERNISMVFQNYALYPHMSVKKNIIYSLQVHKVQKKEIEKRLDNVLDILELKGLNERKPRELSGGQRQRVALARALVKDSKYLLLDEPLSNLDAQLRSQARKELVKIHGYYKQTFIYVTHDQVEAMTIGQRIALMYKGKIMMIDTPKKVYNRPANIFTAKFIGSPPVNIIKAKQLNGAITIGSQRFELPEMWRRIAGRTEDVVFGIRPEHIRPLGKKQEAALCGEVKYIEDYGNKTGIYFDFEGEEFISIQDSASFRPGEKMYFVPDSSRMHLFNGATEESLGYPEELLSSEYQS
jgi:sn-glycerol 3-phosphate transport system ATP-binding protein